MEYITNYKRSNFNFNPFGGSKYSEVLSVIVPNVSLDSIVAVISSQDQIIAELVGNKEEERPFI